MVILIRRMSQAYVSDAWPLYVLAPAAPGANWSVTTGWTAATWCRYV